MSKYNNIYNYSNEEINPLVDGESLIWSAKPKKSAFIINQILIMLPIALIWLGFDSFFILTVLRTSEVKEMLPFIIPFFAFHLMPVWIWVSNVLTAHRKWKNTKYYVTDKRIIISNGFIAENYQTIYYKDIKNVYLHRGIADLLLKVGDIYFDLGYIRKNANNTAMITTFLDVENPNEVYRRIQKIVLDIQSDIEYPNALRPKENYGYNTKYKG